MASRSQEEMHPKSESTELRRDLPKSQGYDGASQQSREAKGMRESPVPQKVSVSDAELETNDIKVGNDGTKRANGQDPLRTARAAESRADTECRHRV
jgi:hypothetical protein